jgi:hypothetical protein
MRTPPCRHTCFSSTTPARRGASTTLVTLTEDEGAGEHTHAGGLSRAHQTMFDWLDTTLTASSARGVREVASSASRAG